jgi:hypothetical protein
MNCSHHRCSRLGGPLSAGSPASRSPVALACPTKVRLQATTMPQPRRRCASPWSGRPPRPGARRSTFSILCALPGIDGMPDAEAQSLLDDLSRFFVGSPRFEYRHQWADGDLMFCDDRCLNLHAAGRLPQGDGGRRAAADDGRLGEHLVEGGGARGMLPHAAIGLVLRQTYGACTAPRRPATGRSIGRGRPELLGQGARPAFRNLSFRDLQAL